MAYEVHHVNQGKADAVLAKYLVGELPAGKASAAAAYTWPADGFYPTLKRKVFERFQQDGGGWGPTAGMKALCFLAVALWACSFVGVVSTGSTAAALLAGFFLNAVFGVGHNFFHQADSPWRYTFDLGSFGHRHWRISHAISHHLYPVRAGTLLLCSGLPRAFLFLVLLCTDHALTMVPPSMCPRRAAPPPRAPSAPHRPTSPPPRASPVRAQHALCAF